MASPSWASCWWLEASAAFASWAGRRPHCGRGRPVVSTSPGRDFRADPDWAPCTWCRVLRGPAAAAHRRWRAAGAGRRDEAVRPSCAPIPRPHVKGSGRPHRRAGGRRSLHSPAGDLACGCIRGRHLLVAHRGAGRPYALNALNWPGAAFDVPLLLVLPASLLAGWLASSRIEDEDSAWLAASAALLLVAFLLNRIAFVNYYAIPLLLLLLLMLAESRKPHPDLQ